jgi:AcrR family transcriptional regulator
MSSSDASATAMGPARVSAREVRRLETRRRIFDAALAEIERHGLRDADVAAIAAAAGVVRGTVYFHFPTKQHVLVELERDEEARIARELGKASADLASALSQLVGPMLDAKRRLGAVIFQDMLGLHFSAVRPAEDERSRGPLTQHAIEVIGQAQARGEVVSNADAPELATFFLTGLFALLATGIDDPELLNRYVTTLIKGIEKR